MSEATETVLVGDEEVSLADIAEIDLGEVEEVTGFATIPAGVYEFRVQSAELTTIDTKDGPRGAIANELEIINVLNLVGASEVDPESLIGRTHRETFFLSNLEEGVGRQKALMARSGFAESGKLTDLLDQFTGHTFIAAVKTRKDKNDPDRIFANIDLKKVQPSEG